MLPRKSLKSSSETTGCLTQQNPRVPCHIWWIKKPQFLQQMSTLWQVENCPSEKNGDFPVRKLLSWFTIDILHPNI
jgi:hypothetical protein